MPTIKPAQRIERGDQPREKDQPRDVQRRERAHEDQPLAQLAAPLITQLQQYTQRLSTPNGATSDELIIDRSRSFFGAREDRNVTFVLPPGFRRFAFGSEVSKDGINGGGYVEWASDNEFDATIHLHGFVDLFSYVRVRVFDVLGVAEQ